VKGNVGGQQRDEKPPIGQTKTQKLEGPPPQSPRGRKRDAREAVKNPTRGEIEKKTQKTQQQKEKR